MTSLSMPVALRKQIAPLDSDAYWPQAHPQVVAAAQAALTDSSYYPQRSGNTLKEHAFVRYGAYPQLTAGIDQALDLLGPLQHAKLCYSRVAETPSDGQWLYLANPSNPQGYAIPAAQLAALLESLPPTVVDETWSLYSDTSLLPDYPQVLDRHIVLKGFSKGWGLGGLRIGMVFGGPPLQTSHAVSHVAEMAAVAALQYEDYSKLQVRRARNNAEETVGELNAVGFNCELTASGFFHIHTPHDVQLLAYLRSKDVYVRRYEDWPGHLRVLYGKPEHLELLQEALAEWAKENL